MISSCSASICRRTFSVGEGEPERLVLALHPAGAKAELDSSARDVVGGRDRVREYRRMAETSPG